METNIPPHEFTGKVMRMTRYKKPESETISLGDGQDPPAHKINPDYKQQPGNPRKCIDCGKTHDTIVEDMRTGERLEEIDKCKDCLFKPLFCEWGGEKIKVRTSDNGWVDMVDELNRLEAEKNGMD